MSEEQKPLHVVKVQKAKITDHEFTRVLTEEGYIANAKADELALHFPNGIDYYVTSESDDDELKFYLNFKLDF